MGRHVAARPLFTVGVVGLLVAPLVASPALASAVRPSANPSSFPPAAQRIAATTATYDAIEAKIAAGQTLGLPFPDPTAAEDILDYGVNDLWKKGIDGAGVTVAYVVTNPDPGLAAAMASYDAAMDLPPANITDVALPAPTNPPPPARSSAPPAKTARRRGDPFDGALREHFFRPPAGPETLGMQGWPEVAQAIKMIADQHLADVITVSLGDGESDFINDPTNPTAGQQAAIRSLDPAFLDAAAHNIPVLFASGDCGPTARRFSATPASAPRRPASPPITRPTTPG